MRHSYIFLTATAAAACGLTTDQWGAIIGICSTISTALAALIYAHLKQGKGK